MSDTISSERQLETLIKDVREAPALNRDLFVKIIDEGGRRLWNLNGRSRAPLSRLVEQGAWIDASLALLDFDSPPWKLRRLLREDGEWFCSLSNARAFRWSSTIRQRLTTKMQRWPFWRRF
jgi:hypothetical protein